MKNFSVEVAALEHILAAALVRVHCICCDPWGRRGTARNDGPKKQWLFAGSALLRSSSVPPATAPNVKLY